MQRKSTAIWKGDIQHGKGELNSASQTLNHTPYSFSSRFENGTGTNPEELVAAAHAGCFAMAFAAKLNEKGYQPESIEVSAEITMEKQKDSWGLTTSRLKLHARVPGIDSPTFQSLAQDAKVHCPVSRALRLEMQLEARLDAEEALGNSLP